MTQDQLRATVLRVIHSTFNTDGDPALERLVAQPDFAFADLGADSVDAIDFCFGVEEETDIEVEMSDLSDHPTLSAFVAMLQDRQDRT